MKQIYACTSNAGKLREFALITGPLELLPLPNLKQINPPEETGETFEENAAQKALYYSRFSEQTVLADDSGIEVDSLGGAPGVHSARYAGLGATDQQNNQLLLQNLIGQSNRTARFVCVLALAQQGSLLLSIRGTVEGEVIQTQKGIGGFGYDSLFFYPPFNLTFAELDDQRKFTVSHRGQALRTLALKLNEKLS